MPFKKSSDSKELETKIKEAETNANQEISEIEKLDDADERLKRYRALSQTLQGVYNDGKPKKVRGRKQTRAEYGSVGNARTLYKLEQAVKEKAEKEAAAISAAQRAAQFQQQFKASFEKEAPADKGDLFKGLEAGTNAKIKEIEKLDDAEARLERYQALDQDLRKFYSGVRPKIRDRKPLRAKYGSRGNAHAVYKLRREVKKKIAKEQEIISSLKRTAQLQQQFKASFGKEAPADKGGIIKEVKAEISEDIKEIKKIDDPAVRHDRYQALDETIDGFYDGIKPTTADGDGAFLGGAGGTIVGLIAGAATAIAVCPPTAGLLALGIMGAGVASGATGGAGLGGLLGGKEDRKRLRAKYGSIRNARAMYKLDKTVQKKAEKEAAPIRSRDRAAKLRQQLDEAFRKKEQAAAAEAAPAQTTETAATPLKLRKLKQ